MAEASYSLYLVRCNDGSLYTGIATDIARRLKEHADSRRGAKYLRGKAPLTLVFERELGDRSVATKVEHQVKKLPRHEKSDTTILSARIEDVLASIESASKE
ncbi:MAG: GIY-YIG nuclease family protein [Woeseiaceae bacterium]|nr:GIY-YIG nuclease family protein [Woeseiaceae bacterium]